jgi:hypothetical protein
LLALEAGDEHLLGPLGGRQIALEHSAEEIYELLVALRLSVLDVGLQRLYVIRGLVFQQMVRSYIEALEETIRLQ